MKKLNKKLMLNKERIASLENEQQRYVFGGQDPTNLVSCTTVVTKNGMCKGPTDECIISEGGTCICQTQIYFSCGDGGLTCGRYR